MNSIIVWMQVPKLRMWIRKLLIRIPVLTLTTRYVTTIKIDLKWVLHCMITQAMINWHFLECHLAGRKTVRMHYIRDKRTRGIQYFFLSLMFFCGLMYIWDLYHLCIVHYTFYLSKDKIQYWYGHLCAHRTSLHNHTLIHCRFNMSRKQDKCPGKFGGICWPDIIWLWLEITHWKKFPVK